MRTEFPEDSGLTVQARKGILWMGKKLKNYISYLKGRKDSEAAGALLCAIFSMENYPATPELAERINISG